MSGKQVTEQCLHLTLFTLKHVCVYVCARAHACVYTCKYKKGLNGHIKKVLVASSGEGSVSQDWDITLYSTFFSIN